jgi:solute carrier family 25 oxoglutarate transporter 11
MALNLGMLVSYDMTKERLEHKMTPNQAFFGAGVVSGAVASTCSLPFDNVKTKLQKQVPLEDGSLKYSGLIDCA